jgi:hypothetical protein
MPHDVILDFPLFRFYSFTMVCPISMLVFTREFFLITLTCLVFGTRLLFPKKWSAGLKKRPVLRAVVVSTLATASVILLAIWGIVICAWFCLRFVVLVNPDELEPPESREPYLNAIAQNRENALHSVAAVLILLLLATVFTLAFRRLMKTNRSSSARPRMRALLILTPGFVFMIGYIFVMVRVAYPDGLNFRLNTAVNCIFGGAGGGLRSTDSPGNH